MFIFLNRKVFFKTPEGAAGAGPAAGVAGGTGGAGGIAGAGAAGEAGKPVVPGTVIPKPGETGAGAAVVDAGKAAADAAKAAAEAAKGKPAEEAKTLLGKEGEPSADGKSKDGDAIPKLDLKVPEGRTVDQAVMAKFVPLMQKHNIPKEVAQELLDLGFENLGNAEKALETRGIESWNTKVKSWEATITADAEVGGPKLKESIGLAAKGARILGGKELIKELDDSGFGNNPVIFKALVKAGRLMKEDKIDGGTSTGSGELTQEQKDAARYPKMEATLKARAESK